jgi:histidyl-tRNA synthetase
VLRILDKLDKQGWEDVFNELVAKNTMGLTPAQAEVLRKFVEMSRSGHSDALLAEAKKTMAGSETALQGIHELWEIRDQLTALGVPETAWRIDFSVARGLGYYTGPVFETVLTKLPGIGSVFSGGRYDGLVERFGKRAVPATGASVGVDRLFTAMSELGLMKKEKVVAPVLVLNFDPEADVACMQIATALRRGGIGANLYLGDERTLQGQLSYGVSQEYPIVVIVGKDEVKRGVAQVKDMRARKQAEVKQKDIVAGVRKIL